MDGIPGWHAHRRAKRVKPASKSPITYTHYLQEDRLNTVRHAEDGDISPMQENFIGGLRIQAPPRSSRPPEIPPKDKRYQPQPDYDGLPTPTTLTPTELSHMTAVERSQKLRIVRMEPHLQVRHLVSMSNVPLTS